MKNIKDTIKELAFSAVSMAEETLTTSCGTEKKAAAIEYIISMLPIPIPFKGITTFLLSKIKNFLPI